MLVVEQAKRRVVQLQVLLQRLLLLLRTFVCVVPTKFTAATTSSSTFLITKIIPKMLSRVAIATKSTKRMILIGRHSGSFPSSAPFSLKNCNHYSYCSKHRFQSYQLFSSLHGQYSSSSSSSSTAVSTSVLCNNHLCRRRRHFGTVVAVAAMATVISIHPVIATSTTTTTNTTDMEAKKRKQDHTTKRDKSTLICHPYGCPLLPKDIYYDEITKEALTKLRTLKRSEIVMVDNNNESNHDATIEEEKKDEEEELTKKEEEVKEAKTLLENTLFTSGDETKGTLTLIGYKGGTLESQINQDRAFCVAPYNIHPSKMASQKSTNNNYNNDDGILTTTTTTTNDMDKLLGVFDGHAKLGEQVSQYVVDELPKLLASKLQTIVSSTEKKSNNNDDDVRRREQQQQKRQEDISKALIETFVELDKTAPADISGGCTASIILQHDKQLYFANAGDSRSFLVVYRGKTETVQIIYITREDKPDLSDERARVEAMGGQVYIPSSRGGTSRVLYVDSMTGMQSGLAMSRSIGDWEAGKLGVIPNPIVEVIDIPLLVQAQLRSTSSSSAGSSSDDQKNHHDHTVASEKCLNSPEDGIFDTDCILGDTETDNESNDKTSKNEGDDSVVDDKNIDDDDDDDDVFIFAVSATDGMMDFTPVDVIAQTIAISLYDNDDGPHLLTALEQLIYYAAQGWEQSKQGRYRDDIAISVSQIRIPPNYSKKQQQRQQ